MARDGSLKVLLVEDSDAEARLLQETIQAGGVNDVVGVSVVPTLHEAIDFLKGNHADATLLDLSLPDSTGLETVRHFRNAFPPMPVVVLTGIEDEKTAVEAVRMGVQDYLVKGHVNGRLIARSVRYAIERKRAEEARNRFSAELEKRANELNAANETLASSRKAALNLMEDAVEARKLAERANEALLERENELVKLNRTLAALSHSSAAMIHAGDESVYLKEVCEFIIKDCGHAMVWIGFTEDDERKSVRPVASAGFEEGYLEKLNITWADTEQGRGPTGTAIRTGKVSMCRNMLTDPAFAPWRKEALRRGYASSIVLPLMAENRAFGAISIYSKDPDPFTENEIELLIELAKDLSHGIIMIRLRAEQERNRKKIEELNEFLKRRADELAIANQGLEAFSYSVAHDLRNPLHSILSCCDALTGSLPKLDGDEREAFGHIEKSSRRMSEVITDLLALSKVSRHEIRREDINLSRIAGAFFEELKKNDPERKVEIVIYPDLIADADHGLAKILLENLLRNAWKYTSKKEHARIELGKQDNGGKAVYFIRDNGAGFDMASAGKMFKPFQRLHTEKEFAGTGIGLAIVKSIVERHGGTVRAEGEKNKGATVYFRLS
jgi:signal transduction histidine kinase/DNA-binding response OmpR family regulator